MPAEANLDWSERITSGCGVLQPKVDRCKGDRDPELTLRPGSSEKTWFRMCSTTCGNVSCCNWAVQIVHLPLINVRLSAARSHGL
jgi:hypothetical protein